MVITICPLPWRVSLCWTMHPQAPPFLRNGISITYSKIIYDPPPTFLLIFWMMRHASFYLSREMHGNHQSLYHSSIWWNRGISTFNSNKKYLQINPYPIPYVCTNYLDCFKCLVVPLGTSNSLTLVFLFLCIKSSSLNGSLTVMVLVSFACQQI